MRNYLLVITIIFVFTKAIVAQTIQSYTAAQAHSHNDYEQKKPFLEAYLQQFGSIEVDLFLVDDSLYAAHHARDIAPDRTFSKLYLQPILQQVRKNGGTIYAQKDIQLQLLIDLKTPAEETLAALIKILDPYKKLLAPLGSVKIVVSGNTPAPENFEKYPSYIYIDGRPEVTYTTNQLERVGLISQSFQKYTRWNGEGDLTDRDKKNLSKVVQDIHKLGKKVRFWGTPDNIHTWKTMMELQVDYLNTDQVIQMGDYLRTAPR
jgi:glycerophosphoryl diester phosphodiesterase